MSFCKLKATFYITKKQNQSSVLIQLHWSRSPHTVFSQLALSITIYYGWSPNHHLFHDQVRQQWLSTPLNPYCKSGTSCGCASGQRSVAMIVVDQVTIITSQLIWTVQISGNHHMGAKEILHFYLITVKITNNVISLPNYFTSYKIMCSYIM